MIDYETNSQFNSRTGSVGDFESYAFGHSDFFWEKGTICIKTEFSSMLASPPTWSLSFCFVASMRPPVSHVKVLLCNS